MKKSYLIQLLLLLGHVCAQAQGPDYGRTFLRETRVLKSGAKDTAAVNALSAADAARTVTYYDGLGFPSQVIAVGAVPGGIQDMVLHREYDRYMRESKVFLPYADLSSGEGFRTDAAAETVAFYDSADRSGMTPDRYPYSVTVFDNSTLDRVLQQGAPGRAWQPDVQRTDTSGRTDVTDYGTCRADVPGAVRLWTVTSSGISCSGNYSPGSLVRKTFKNANWTSGMDGTEDVFIDLSGRTVLERRWCSTDGTPRHFDTYYVYDLTGRLRYVLPPMLSEALSGMDAAMDDDTPMKNYAYIYRYDGRGNCIWKRLPGCGPVTMKYDAHHRLVMSQDGNQAANGKWTVIYYDGLGRSAVTYEGPAPYDGDVSQTVFAASYSGDGMTGGYVLSPPLPSGASLMKIQYYDGYGFIDSAPESCRDSLYAYSASGIRTTEHDRYGRGRATGAVTWTVGSSHTPLYSSCHYDDRGLVVQSRSQNHTGGFDTERTGYSFTGQPAARFLCHTTAASGPLTETYSYTYDNMDRPLRVTHRLCGGDEVTLSDNSYDPLGRLGADRRNGNEALLRSCKYNIRSWLTENSCGIFSEHIRYNDIQPGASGTAPQFNGNASACERAYSGGVQNSCGYSYDGLGRLTGASRSSGKPAGAKVGTEECGRWTAYSYDPHGNLLSISRDSCSGDGDEFLMAYQGNRLAAMSNRGESMVPDFIGSIPTGIGQYGYDGNGNMTHDLNGGLLMMSYNTMNLPAKINFVTEAGPCTTRYLYSANGVKLRTEMSGAAGSVTEDCCSNVVYRNGAADRIMVPGGYIRNGEYLFFVTDRLGSIRAVADSAGNVLQTLDYYPYGLEIADGQDSADYQPYRFNGKESQEFAGLPYLDYGARFYHTLSARWTTPDPLAEKYCSVSPYAFCAGNPVNFVDPDGMAVWAQDEQSRNNIINTLTEDEAKYVKFNSDGKLNTRKLNKSDSQSENMTALKALANSDIKYNFQTSASYLDNGVEKEFKQGDSWENGITLIPGAKSNPSPDDNVYVITNSFLSPGEQTANTAHEAYGHAYFYELRQQGKDVNPFHKYRYADGEEMFDESVGFTVTITVRIETNIQLNEQIKKVVNQAHNNYNSRLR